MSTFDLSPPIYSWSHSTQNIRVAVLGSRKVGKTALVHQYLFQTFREDYKPTIADMHYKDLGDLDIDILDTGMSDCQTVRNIAIKRAHAFVLVYAVDDQESFEYIVEVRNQIVAEKGEDTPIVVVGNKIDKMGDRAVPRALAECLFAIDYETPYREVCASDNCQVTKVFTDLFNHRSFKNIVRRLVTKLKYQQLYSQLLNSTNKLDNTKSAKWTNFITRLSCINKLM